MKYFKFVGLIALAAGFAVFATGCTKDVNSTSDSLACVYDGSKNGGQRLKHVVPPSQHITTDVADKVVEIPTSNRFFAASLDRAIRDPLAPHFYDGFAKDNVEIKVQGQIRFRFNTAKACEWYAKHGRRNLGGRGDLGFNARGPEQQDTGWAHFLAENFGVTMQQVVQERSGFYSWPSLVYNYPSNADQDTGQIKNGGKPGTPEDLLFGRDLGKVFTERLKDNLGGDYFCGIDVSITGQSSCPDMVFQVFKVTTANPELQSERSNVEALRQQVENEKAAAKINADDLHARLKSAESQRKIFELQLQNALLQAQTKYAKCIVLGKVGLDCNGNRPAVVFGNPGK